MPGLVPPSGTDGQWYLWTPSAGSLTISFADDSAVGAVWIPAPIVPITFAIGDTTFYVMANGGAETVPMPYNTQSVTLSGGASEGIYVFASSLPYNPFKEIATVNQLSMRMQLSGSDYTPVIGTDTASVKVIPWSPTDDVTPVTWSIVDIFLRVETAGSATSTARVEYSTSTGAFISEGYVDANGISVASGVNESTRPTSIAVPTLTSGDKVRVVFSAVGAGVDGASLYLLLEETT